MERVLLPVFLLPNVHEYAIYRCVSVNFCLYQVLSPNQSSTALIGKVKPFNGKVPAPEILPQLANSFFQEGKGRKINCCAE